jgi:hypothetical protein
MLSALKAVAAIAAAGSVLAAPAPIAAGSLSSSGHALAARDLIVKPKVMIISMVRPEQFSGSEHDPTADSVLLFEGGMRDGYVTQTGG